MSNRLTKVRATITVLGIVASCGCSGCMGPSYTWSYEHSASPIATSAYIRAVMAAEAGQDEIALKFYDMALSREYSQKAHEEREAVAKRVKAKKAAGAK